MTLTNLIDHPDSVDMPPPPIKWREIRSNARDFLLRRSQDGALEVNCTAGGTIVLTVDEREAAGFLRLIGTPGAAFTIQWQDRNKQVQIENVSGQTATIDTVTGAASPIVIPTATTALIQLRGADMTRIAIVSLQVGALLHSGQVVVAGTQDFSGRKIKQVTLLDPSYEITDPSSAAGVLTLDMELGNWFESLLTEDVTTLNLNNPPVGSFNLLLEDGSGSLLLEDASGYLINEASDAVGSIFLFARQDGTGGWSITWPASVIWERGTGTSPDQTLTPNALDIYWFFTRDGGTTWYGHLLGLNMG